jgi:flagellar hook-length control protein FliK
VLQLNIQSGQAALTQNGESRLGSVREATELSAARFEGQLFPGVELDGFAELQTATQEALEPVVAQEAVEQLVADETSAQVADIEQAPQAPQLAASIAAPPEPIAEQWLLGMLGQRAVQVEARDGGESGRTQGDSRAAVSEPALQWRSNALAGLPMAAVQGGREAALSPDATVAGAVLVQAPANTANPSSEAAAPLDSQPAGQLQRSSGEAALLVEAGKAAASTTKILGEVAAPTVAGPEPLDGQLLAQLERLSGQAATAPTEAGTASAGPGQTVQAPGLERTLKLQAPEAKWGEQMLHALRESVELQLQQRVQHTSIRLDPPELGSLEIFLSHESGRLSVQISAAQGDVARLLQHTSERLRQELVGQNFLQVSADGQPSQQHERQGRARLFDEAPVMAGSLDAEQPEQGPASCSGDVLITV